MKDRFFAERELFPLIKSRNYDFFIQAYHSLGDFISKGIWRAMTSAIFPSTFVTGKSPVRVQFQFPSNHGHRFVRSANISVVLFASSLKLKERKEKENGIGW